MLKSKCIWIWFWIQFVFLAFLLHQTVVFIFCNKKRQFHFQNYRGNWEVGTKSMYYYYLRGYHPEQAGSYPRLGSSQMAGPTESAAVACRIEQLTRVVTVNPQLSTKKQNTVRTELVNLHNTKRVLVVPTGFLFSSSPSLPHFSPAHTINHTPSASSHQGTLT